MNKSLIYIVDFWLKSLNHNLKDFEMWYSSHPDFPSLKSLTDTLNYFGTESITAEIDEQTLMSFDKPFLSLIRSDNNVENLVYTTFEQDKIKIITDEDKFYILTLEDFLKKWKNIVVVIDENKKIQSKRKLDYNVLFLLLFVFNISLLILNHFTWNSFILSSLFLSGLYISTLLIQKKLNLSSVIADKFCTISEKTSCEKVTQSQESKLFGKVPLDILSFVYFFTLIVCEFILPNNNLSKIISCISFPICFYSVYLQWKVIKSWCPLCLLVVSVLSLSTAFSIFTGINFKIGINEILIFLFVSSITSLSVSFLVPYLKNRTMIIELKKENLSFKRNYHLFMPHYSYIEPIIYKDFIERFSIKTKVGNFNMDMIVVTNPMCESCKELHSILQNITERHKNIRLSYVFYVPYEDRSDPRTFVAERLLEIYHEQNNSFDIALNEWYEKRETWIGKWGLCKNLKYNYYLGEHKAWCSNHGIHQTPIILINGKQFPKFYDANDISFFIDYIVNFEMNSQLQRL